MQRSALFRSRFGEHKGTVGKIEGGQTLTASQFRARRLPVQPAGNHQVQHQPEIVFYSNDNALANSTQLADNAAFHTGQRRLRVRSKKALATRTRSNG